MPAYSIVGVTVNNGTLFQQYIDGHTDSLETFGGRFLAAGNDFELIEGSWPDQVFVIHEWPDQKAFRDWYASEEYRPWKKMRHAAATANVVLIDGMPV